MGAQDTSFPQFYHNFATATGPGVANHAVRNEANACLQGVDAFVGQFSSNLSRLAFSLAVLHHRYTRVYPAPDVSFSIHDCIIQRI